MKNKNYKSKPPVKKNLISNVSYNRDRKKEQREKLNDGVLVYSAPLTVTELSEKLGLTPIEIVKCLFLEKVMVNVNTTLSDDLVEIVCLKYGYEVKKEVEVSLENFEDIQINDDSKMLSERPPVVTIMGHVDHGKTTLLDYIRKSRVVAGEFGGITQHIGAYQTTINGKKITFIDTPGHAAFTKMRLRGAQITDIVIIVVAADDGVMPQTKEAIDHAKAAKVPIIVAINKMDKEHVNPDKIMSQMTDLGLVPEEWGGDTIFRPISAKTGKGVDTLLETILVVAEMAELKANPHRYAMGTVVEAKLDKGRGTIATFLVQNGTLRVGDCIVAGTVFGKVRQLKDDHGRTITEATPSTPVEVSGLHDVPEAGDKFMAFENEKMARDISDKRRIAKENNNRILQISKNFEDLIQEAKNSDNQVINVIIKSDVQGSAEAVKGALEKLNVEGIKVNVLSAQAGAITESDVLLADASHAIVYGFNVRPDAMIRRKAQESGVDIKLYNVIYALTEEMEAAMKGMLKPVEKEVVTGQAGVRQLFKVGKVGTIAGCYVTMGYIERASAVRIIRNGIVVYTGKLASLKRFTDDVKEVKEGFECGMMVENYNDVKENDIIEGYKMEEVAR